MPDRMNSQPPSAKRPDATATPEPTPTMVASTVTVLGEMPLAFTSSHSGRITQLK